LPSFVSFGPILALSVQFPFLGKRLPDMSRHKCLPPLSGSIADESITDEKAITCASLSSF